MKIQKIESQHRRDFTATYECEDCGATTRSYGYDDTNFHQTVIPNMKCRECGKRSVDLGDKAARPLAPKYPEDKVI